MEAMELNDSLSVVLKMPKNKNKINETELSFSFDVIQSVVAH